MTSNQVQDRRFCSVNASKGDDHFTERGLGELLVLVIKAGRHIVKFGICGQMDQVVDIFIYL